VSDNTSPAWLIAEVERRFKPRRKVAMDRRISERELDRRIADGDIQVARVGTAVLVYDDEQPALADE
jgi:hypothetical protein